MTSVIASTPTVCRHLKRNGFTRKKVQYIAKQQIFRIDRVHGICNAKQKKVFYLIISNVIKVVVKTDIGVPHVFDVLMSSIIKGHGPSCKFEGK